MAKLCEVPPFGPQTLACGLQTFAISAAVGDLTALATGNVMVAERLAVFIPGFTGSKEDFVDFFPVLMRSLDDGGCRAVLSYSQRGQADSASPRGIESYTLDDFVGDACEVLQTLGAEHRPVDLVGHSFGGVVARRIALRMPESVRSLTLFSTGATPIPSSDETRKARGLLASIGPSLIYRSAYPERGDEVQADPYVEMFRLRAHATSLDNLLGISSILGSYADVTAELGGTGVPMLSVHGANDKVWPEGVYDDEARRLGIATISIAGAAHSAQIDEPARLAHVLTGFWSSIQ
ncbi:alpha/beta fold hydrolase [Bifidobacterium sp.]|uniref:alpha/beta fold hydrolase n=1 Tax=Bifidobacterium sp. TaxID=41200 RepID=UPI0025BEEE33|nr:alpha/beta hydrolase [Bifidobacterium sp.]MCH4209313.1 alpha/beta hydrolase [Bifidobacterium sp.]MCI1224107.1 alpha/beta hydrolase [Bifidobacterium sp.]